MVLHSAPSWRLDISSNQAVAMMVGPWRRQHWGYASDIEANLLHEAFAQAAMMASTESCLLRSRSWTARSRLIFAATTIDNAQTGYCIREKPCCMLM